jgi:ribosomal protein S18 acetylase RimI-like enzyme
MNSAAKSEISQPATMAEPDVKIVRLDVSSLKEAKSIIYQAYHYEPTFKYLFDAERPGYDQRIRATIRELMELHFQKGQDAIGVTLDDQLVAVAFIGSPDVRLKLSDQLNWRLRMMLTAGLSSTRRYIDYHEQVASCLPSDQHHELPLWCVHPKYQNRGIGQLLLNAVEQVCAESARSAGIGLDTGNSRYLDFYHRMGYETVGEVKIGDVTEYVLFKPKRRA